MKELIRSIILIIILGFLVYFIDHYQEIEESWNNLQQKNSNEILEKEEDDFLEIYFLDVGEADCILMRNLGENILIDAGNNKDGKKIVSFLKELGIEEFQYVITTHPHEDHIGGMDDIIRNFRINHFYIPNVSVDYITYTEVIDLLKEKEILIETPKIEDTFQVNNISCNIVWIGDDPVEINWDSIVLKCNYYENSFLFMADATIDVEKKILENDIKSDVLKVGHHGSSSSSSAHFLKRVDPSIAIISVGKENDYGFPKQITLDKLERLNTKVYRTDLLGTIHLISDGKEIRIDSIPTDTNQE